MKKEIDIFFTALMFLTRIPCPKNIDHSPEILKKSTRYFSLVGSIVGGISAVSYVALSYILPSEIAVFMSILTSIWVTGGFHEDGFADVCDGFGGGWTREKILTIMKDSRLGTYGTVGLIGIITLKYLALLEIPPYYLLLILVSGHSISRFTAIMLLYFVPYARDPNDSKMKDVAEKISLKNIVINAFFGLLPLVFFQNYRIFLVVIPLFLTLWKMSRFFKKWIGGQTGDCAGATQQVAEIIFYLSFLVLWKFIW